MRRIAMALLLVAGGFGAARADVDFPGDLRQAHMPVGPSCGAWSTDAGALPSGVYFARLESEAGSATAKLLLVK